MIAAILLVIGCRSSSHLAGAYGIAVTLAMLIDSISLFVVLRRLWQWSTVLAAAIVVPFVVIDVAFLASNSLKIPEGGSMSKNATKASEFFRVPSNRVVELGSQVEL